MPKMPSELIVGVSYEKSISEMFDIVESIDRIIELVPACSIKEAKQHKTNAVNKMVNWIDAT